MASIYQRAHHWWIKFQPPGTKKILRYSLETSDASRARILQRRIELELALMDPRLRLAELPDGIREQLGQGKEPPVPPSPAVPYGPPAVAARPRVTIENAARTYLEFVKKQNVPHTFANKVSMLRRFLGEKRAAEIVGPSASTQRFGKHRTKRGRAGNTIFQGEYLDELTAAVVQHFIDGLPVSTKTKRPVWSVRMTDFAEMRAMQRCP